MSVSWVAKVTDNKYLETANKRTSSYTTIRKRWTSFFDNVIEEHCDDRENQLYKRQRWDKRNYAGLRRCHGGIPST